MHDDIVYKNKFIDIMTELEDANDSQIDYSDIPPMTEEEQKTARFYYKEFLDKLPSQMVKELVQQRLSEAPVKGT